MTAMTAEQQWTAADDRALAVEAAWQAHVRDALAQATPVPTRPDRRDEMVTEDAAAMTERHARSADAVHRRDGLAFVLAAMASVTGFGLLVAGLVAVAVTR